MHNIIASLKSVHKFTAGAKDRSEKFAAEGIDASNGHARARGSLEGSIHCIEAELRAIIAAFEARVKGNK